MEEENLLIPLVKPISRAEEKTHHAGQINFKMGNPHSQIDFKMENPFGQSNFKMGNPVGQINFNMKNPVGSKLFSPARRFRTRRLEAATRGEVALEVK